MSATLRRRGVLAGGGAAAFAPTDIAGLEQWVKADDLSLSDADPVATWADLSGNGNDFTQATADNRPAYKVNIVNGLPVVRATSGVAGSSDFMTSALPMANTDNFTKFMTVSARVLSGAGDAAKATYNIGTGANGYAMAPERATLKKAFLRGGLAWHTSSEASTTAWEVWVLRRSAGTWKLWTNGGAAILTLVGSAPTAPTTRASLFSHTGNASNNCDHDLQEAGCYSVAATDDEVNSLGSYLADRIDTTWTAIS